MTEVDEKYEEMHRIAVTAIIYRWTGDGLEYLVTQRSHDKIRMPGKWTVPGGGVVAGDYIGMEHTHDGEQWYNAVERTLRREVDEETGLEIGEVEFLVDLAFIREDGVPTIVLSFYAEHDSGEVELDDESIDYAWITADDVGEYDLIDGIDEEILMVEERLGEGDRSAASS